MSTSLLGVLMSNAVAAGIGCLFAIVSSVETFSPIGLAAAIITASWLASSIALSTRRHFAWLGCIVGSFAGVLWAVFVAAQGFWLYNHGAWQGPSEGVGYRAIICACVALPCCILLVLLIAVRGELRD